MAFEMHINPLMKTFILIIVLGLFQSAFSSELKVVYNEKKLPKCLYHESRPDLGIMLFWDDLKKIDKREIYYSRINNLLSTEGDYLSAANCKNALKIKNLNLKGKEIDFVKILSEEKIEEFHLNEELMEKLIQIKKGNNRFVDYEFFKSAENLKNTFEPFHLKNYRGFIKDLNKDESTKVMHQWIKAKNFPSDCSKMFGNCDYYLCKENEKPCDSSGYYLNFGYVYCSQSIDHLTKKVSPRGKVWLETVATCLQEKTEGLSKDLTCKEIKKEAIETHDSCYSKINFCSLDPKDIALVINMIKKELKDIRIIKEGIEVLLSCGSANGVRK